MDERCPLTYPERKTGSTSGLNITRLRTFGAQKFYVHKKAVEEDIDLAGFHRLFNFTTLLRIELKFKRLT